MGVLGKENSVCSGVQRHLVKENSFGFGLATLIEFMKAARSTECLPGKKHNSQKEGG